jgi:hypothetical protein
VLDIPVIGDADSQQKVTLDMADQHWIYINTQLISTSAKCNSVQKPYTNLPHTPVALTSASKYFQMLPAHPGALQSALGLCKSILRCSWKNLQLWRCIQDATRLTIRIVKVWSYRYLCTGLQETSKETRTSAQLCRRLWEQLRPLRKLCGTLVAKFSQQWLLDSGVS